MSDSCISALDMATFDRWREQYAELSDNAHRLFYDEIARSFPDQSHVDTQCVLAFLEWAKPDRESILEIGGWDGALAKEALAAHAGIIEWHNMEICSSATQRTVCHDARYSVETPSSFRWWKGYDVSSFQIFIAAHVLEHLTWDDAKDVLSCMRGCRAVYLEIPIMRYHTTRWKGYEGTHILEVSWTTVQKHMEHLGFTMTKISDLVMWGSKEGTHES